LSENSKNWYAIILWMFNLDTKFLLGSTKKEYTLFTCYYYFWKWQNKLNKYCRSWWDMKLCYSSLCHLTSFNIKKSCL
jgi:hypothetical protein